MSDPEVRSRMRAEYDLLRVVGSSLLPENLTIIATPDHPELEQCIGKTVGEIAKERGAHPNDTMLDLAIAGDLKTRFRSGSPVSYDTALVGPLMSDPYVIAGVSDGGAHCKSSVSGSYTTEFLTWLARDTNQISLEEAHCHLSYMPAQAPGFADRGFLREGAPADVVVYKLEDLKRVPEWEYEVVHDLPGGEWRLVQRSAGYRWTIVNGVIPSRMGSAPTLPPDDCCGIAELAWRRLLRSPLDRSVRGSRKTRYPIERERGSMREPEEQKHDRLGRALHRRQVGQAERIGPHPGRLGEH